MTNLDLFLECVVHRDHRLYGFKLLPLSLFHLAMIEKFAPSVLTAKPSEQDLQLVACICASKDQPDFDRKSRSWITWLSPLWKFEKQVRLFDAYLTDFMSFPEIATKGSGEKNDPFPYVLMFAAKLIERTGYSFREVFYETPVSQIYWLVLALGYVETGETSVVSDKERAIYRMIAEQGKVTG